MKTPHYNRMTQKEISIQNQSEIKVLSDKMIIVESDLKDIKTGVTKILFYLNSDAETNSEGLIEKTNRVVNELDAVKGKIKDVKVVAATVSFLIGAVFTILKLILR